MNQTNISTQTFHPHHVLSASNHTNQMTASPIRNIGNVLTSFILTASYLGLWIRRETIARTVEGDIFYNLAIVVAMIIGMLFDMTMLAEIMW
mmetsp:Transcript_31226/g.65992  ORF Transcript_31226/g.65992 Transcript_31226/m.65992 type:complete len:92 (-) Transcript_31226:609-884(-)